VDICLIIDGKTASWDFKKDFDLDGIADWMEIVRIFKKYGWEWGGDWRKFPDAPHFQKTFGLSIADLISGKRP
jgi:peptidoglycan L-alanyl-D-glutamate endopeptidase CwlK